MSFDYKDLGRRLRQKFANAAGAESILRRLDFEEAMSSRRYGRPTMTQEVLRVLDENVPNLSGDVVGAALLLPLARGMVTENKAPAGVSKGAHDLYVALLRCNDMPSLAVTKSPEVAQLAMAMVLVKADLIEEMHRVEYVPYAHFAQLSAHMSAVRELMHAGSATSGSTQLDKLFVDTADRIEVTAKNFFNAPGNPKPPQP